MHVLEFIAANHPRSQEMHVPARSSEYVPFPQIWHAVAPASEKVPALHVSQLVFLPIIVEYAPAGHRLQSRSVVFVQAVHPGVGLYFPAAQERHGPPALPNRPGRQLQFSMLHESGWLNVPSEQVPSSPE